MKFHMVILFFISTTSIYGMYDRGSKVQVLNQNDFNSKVVNGKGLWLVEFFAPWCGHCKNLEPEYEKVARSFEGILNIAAVDMDANPSVGSPYNVQGFPTIKLFGDNKNSPIDYQGERSSSAIIDWLLDQTKRTVQARVSGKGRQSSSSSKSENKQGSSNAEVIVLEDSNFDSNVMGSKDSWFVEFYAPWCGHCKKLEPEWNKLASDLNGYVKVAKVDATVNTNLAQRFGVTGYPSIKFFPAGMTSDSQIIDYGGSRDASSMENWAREQAEQFKELKLAQLINQSQLDDYCTNFNGVCVILFLPHIYDSSKNERNQYLKDYEQAQQALKGKPISYLWAQGGDFFQFEDSFQSASGYPSVLAIVSKKGVFSKLRGVFNKTSLERFLRSLLVGGESFNTFKEIPKIKTVSQWDGEDHKIEQTREDDYDL